MAAASASAFFAASASAATRSDSRRSSRRLFPCWSARSSLSVGSRGNPFSVWTGTSTTLGSKVTTLLAMGSAAGGGSCPGQKQSGSTSSYPACSWGGSLRYSASQMSMQTPFLSDDEPGRRARFSHFMYRLPSIGSCPEISHLVPQCVTFWNLLGGPSGSGASTWTREQAGVVGVGRAAARGRGRQRGGESPHGEGAGPHPPSSHLQPSGTCSAAPRAPALAALGLLRLLHRPEGSHLRQRHLRRRRCRRAPRGTLPLPRRLRIRRRARLLGGRFRRLPPPQRSFRCFRAGSRRHRYR